MSANVQICQGVGDSYEAVVKDARQRFPELEDVEKSMRKVWKKYDLDSYPEFPLSCLRDCVDEDCVEEDEVEDEVEDEEEYDCDDYNDRYNDYDYDDCEDDEDYEDEDGEDEDNNENTTTNDDAEEVEEQAADGIEQLLPEFVNSFTVLNSSTSLNYIFSPVITLPTPYKKDDAYSDSSPFPLCGSESSAVPEANSV